MPDVLRRIARQQVVAALLLLLALAGAVWGWTAFRFLTDDAFIAFRYVHNHVQGHGWVWNPPPFRPVEGYTSFLWVVILSWVWRLFGVDPPTSANFLSLGFGCGTLVLVAAMVMRMRLPGSWARFRPWFLGLVLLGTVTNRTFLAWLSSGLETALFNFCLTLWVFCVLGRKRERRVSWIVCMSSSASLAALARPDGVLAVLATLGLLALDPLDPDRRPLPPPRLVLACLPLLASPIHFLWRWSFYGAWLPNTYYAKAGDPWPEYGDDRTIGQHHATMLPRKNFEGLPLKGAGNILIFDNGGHGGYPRQYRFQSRVLLINPRSGNVVWQYDAEDSGIFIKNFFSMFKSSAQRLPNGNTLITESTWGRIFEVRPKGKIVWEYINPYFKNKQKGDHAKGRQNHIYRAYRVSLDWPPDHAGL